ncbi:MAG: tRNA (adenosine(37)-N6)-dimethylallyltransferase MiaA [Parvularculaceae bacterium]
MPDVPSSGKTILIAGPTASGKSAAALGLARMTGGEIVNADAVQVYKDLEILSARPGKDDLAVAPHHLFGFVDGATRYSAGEWARAAQKAIAQIHARARAAIIVGGTGLYFRALEAGLAEIPAAPADIRDAAARRYESIGAEKFREEVLSFDPDMQRLEPADRQRHIRAWEVYMTSGTPLSAFQSAPAAPIVAQTDARILIEPPRESLYAAINARFDDMIAAGALDEARALYARALAPDLPVMKAVGAGELVAHLKGEAGLEDAIELAKRNTRRLAKRQLTWFRHQANDWLRVASTREAVAALP